MQVAWVDPPAAVTLRSLAELAKKHKVAQIQVEANFGGGMFTKLLKPWLSKVGHQCAVEEVTHSQQKERRIVDTLRPVLDNHRLVVDRSVNEADYTSVQVYPPERRSYYSLFYQLTRLTAEKDSLAQDNRLDALAIAVAYWTEAMARDQDKAAAEERRKALDKELKGWRGNVFGGMKGKQRTPLSPLAKRPANFFGKR